MELNKKTEDKLKKEVLKYLKEGKPDWDVPHTLSSVDWMRKLIKNEGGDEKILITAMYLHDIGYPKMKKGYKWEDILNAKAIHGKKGAKIGLKILKKIGGYSDKEIKRILYLIETHDELDKISEKDEILVKEADGLSQIELDRTIGNLDKESHDKFLKNFKEKRMSTFKTKTGQRSIKQLFRG